MPGLHSRMLAEIEKPLIIETLYHTAGNQIKAAHILGLNRNTLRKKIKELTGAWIADQLQPGTRRRSPFQVEPESKSGLNTDPNARSEPNPYSANVRTQGS